VPRSLSSRLSLWLPPALYTALIFYLSSLPNPFFWLEKPPATDWLVHGAEYAMLQILLLRALSGGMEKLPGWRRLILALALGWATGALDEFWQSFTPGRFSTVLDALADAMGALAGSVLYMPLSRMLRLRAEKKSRSR
jgi:VanZ family protein